MKKALLLTLLLGAWNYAQAASQDTVNFTFHGLITRSTCSVGVSGDKHVQMITKNAEDFASATEIEATQTPQDITLTCPQDLPIKVKITDAISPATNRDYLVNKTGTCNITASGTTNRNCATGVGVVPQIFDGATRKNATPNNNLGNWIILNAGKAASASGANYYTDTTRTYTVKGAYRKIGSANPTPGGVEAKALFTFEYQ